MGGTRNRVVQSSCATTRFVRDDLEPAVLYPPLRNCTESVLATVGRLLFPGRELGPRSGIADAVAELSMPIIRIPDFAHLEVLQDKHLFLSTCLCLLPAPQHALIPTNTQTSRTPSRFPFTHTKQMSTTYSTLRLSPGSFSPPQRRES